MKNNGNKGYERVNSSVTEEFSSKAGRGATEAFDINSPIRLIVGGRARLVRLASSHQVAISGSRVCRPRAKIIVRLWTRS